MLPSSKKVYCYYHYYHYYYYCFHYSWRETNKKLSVEENLASFKLKSFFFSKINKQFHWFKRLFLCFVATGFRFARAVLFNSIQWHVIRKRLVPTSMILTNFPQKAKSRWHLVLKELEIFGIYIVDLSVKKVRALSKQYFVFMCSMFHVSSGCLCKEIVFSLVTWSHVVTFNMFVLLILRLNSFWTEFCGVYLVVKLISLLSACRVKCLVTVQSENVVSLVKGMNDVSIVGKVRRSFPQEEKRRGK